MKRGKLKILQIINAPWLNAVVDYGLTLSKGLRDKGHDIILAGLKNSPLEREAKSNDLRFETIEGINSLNPINVFMSIRQLKNIIKREQVDIINTHRSEGQTLGFFANKFAGSSSVLIRTRADQRPAKNHIFNSYLYRSLTDRVIVASKMAKENHFTGFNINNKISVVPPAVDTKIFNPDVPGKTFRNKHGINENNILVGIIGRLDPVKGHSYFLEAAGLLEKSHPNIKYVIVGKEVNTKISKLKELVSRLGLDGKVVFTGFVDNIPEVVSAIDLGVVASTGSEAVSRVSMEIMACAKPVVATSVGSIPELVIENFNGLLCDPCDSHALAKCISHLISNPQLMKEMGGKGLSRIKEIFSIDNLIKNTEEIYYEVLFSAKKKQKI